MKINCQSIKNLFCCKSKSVKKKKLKRHETEDKVQSIYLNNLPKPVERVCVINANHSRVRSTDVLDFRSMIKWNGYIGAKK